MASSSKDEFPAYMQFLGEFAFSSTKFAWSVAYPIKPPLRSHNVSVPVAHHEEYNFFMFLDVEKKKPEEHEEKGTQNTELRIGFEYYDTIGRSPNQLQLKFIVTVTDHHKEIIVDEITMTSMSLGPRWRRLSGNEFVPMPRMLSERIQAQRTDGHLTFNCCIQRIAYPTNGRSAMAQNVQTGRTWSEIQAKCLHDLNDDLNREYTTGRNVDVFLKCKDGTIKAHKLIVLARMPALSKRMSSEKIDISDTRTEIAQLLLKFAYHGTADEYFNNLKEDVLKELFMTAQNFEIHGLIKHLCNVEPCRMKAVAMSLVKQNAAGGASNLSNVFHQIYQDTKPIDVFRTEEFEGVEFTWEVDLSGFFSFPFFMASKQFPFFINDWLRNASIVIGIEEGYKCYLCLRIKDYDYQRMGTPFIQIRFDVSYGGRIMDHGEVSINYNSETYCKIMDLPNMGLSIKDQKMNRDLKCVPIHCCFKTPRTEPLDELSKLTPIPELAQTAGPDIYRSHMKKLRTDVTLFDSGDQGHDVHKLILCARSPVFSAMFESGLSEQTTGEVKINDIDGEVMQQLIKFMYTATISNCDPMNRDMKRKLLYAADKYELKGLKLLCEALLCKDVTTNNALDMIVLADRHNATALLKKAQMFIGKNLAYIEQTYAFEKFKLEHANLIYLVYQEGKKSLKSK